MLVVLIGYFIGKARKREEDEEENEDGYMPINDDEEEPEEELKRRGIVRLLSIIPTIVGIIVFILTEDMSLPMQLTDEWTWVMAVIAIVQVVVAAFTKKKRSKDEDQMDEAEPQGI